MTSWSPRVVSVVGEEVVLTPAVPRSQVRPVVRCRSTLLAASVRSIRERGLLGDYEKRLPRQHRDVLMFSVAGTWHPIEVAEAHYQACNDLGLTPAQQVAIGGEVSDRLEKTFLTAVLKLATESGVTPWTGLAHCQKIFTRLFGDEGGVELVKVGPKDARIEIVGLSLARIPYFRMAYIGVIQSGCEMFCRRAFVRILPKLCTSTTLGYTASWA